MQVIRATTKLTLKFEEDESYFVILKKYVGKYLKFTKCKQSWEIRKLYFDKVESFRDILSACDHFCSVKRLSLQAINRVYISANC